MNFSEYGQWVTTAKRTIQSEDGQHDFNISGWYFTVLKLKVVGSDMKVENPIRMYDKDKKLVEGFKRGEEYSFIVLFNFIIIACIVLNLIYFAISASESKILSKLS